MGKRIMNKKVALCLLSLCFCACDGSTALPENGNETGDNNPVHEDNKEYLKYYENDKYIVGKRIYDDVFDCHLEDGEYTLEIPEVKEAECVYRDGIVDIKKNGVLKHHGRSLYIADVNQDGYFDLCYTIWTQWTDLLSNKDNDRIYVYDAHNDKDLDVFNTINGYRNDTKSYYFDLDENNVLYIIETRDDISVHELARIERAARLLKNQETFFEWFDMDTKIFNCRFFGSLMYEERSIQPEIIIQFIGFIKKDLQLPITIDQISIEKIDGPDFNVYIEAKKNLLNIGDYGRFDAYLTFTEPGIYNIKATAGEFSSVEKFDIPKTYLEEEISRSYYTHYDCYYDAKTNLWDIVRGWPKIYFGCQDYLMAQSEDELENYFGIENEKNITFSSNEEYDAFKAKVAELENNGLVLDKDSKVFPYVDFTSSKIIATAFYKPEYVVYSELNYVRQNNNDLVINMKGTYSEDFHLDNGCHVCFAYLVINNDMEYNVSGKMVYSKDRA